MAAIFSSLRCWLASRSAGSTLGLDSRHLDSQFALSGRSEGLLSPSSGPSSAGTSFPVLKAVIGAFASLAGFFDLFACSGFRAWTDLDSCAGCSRFLDFGASLAGGCLDFGTGFDFFGGDESSSEFASSSLSSVSDSMSSSERLASDCSSWSADIAVPGRHLLWFRATMCCDR